MAELPMGGEPNFEMDMRWFINKLVKVRKFNETIRIRKQINMMLDAYQNKKKDNKN